MRNFVGDESFETEVKGHLWALPAGWIPSSDGDQLDDLMRAARGARRRGADPINIAWSLDSYAHEMGKKDVLDQIRSRLVQDEEAEERERHQGPSARPVEQGNSNSRLGRAALMIAVVVCLLALVVGVEIAVLVGIVVVCLLAVWVVRRRRSDR
ncbi:hypothetical protein QX204_34225 (plasmid) [Nocardia sp. PE-7]|uniref:hypothetical protein n=1 Tax=Nocardia sp. PE-7 TaxID=3058426 RepID=UPI00265AC836|nr:hypothetical protein [Nocardia sp. PE-7]WKG13544.1 hypothetical protein QX204_34225 [Nocardia sp. PE-7]